MANIRTLKLNLLADTKDFSNGIRKASGQTDSFSTKLTSSMKSVAKSAALAGVAVAGMAVAFGVDAVKAAIVDEKSQRRLAKALQNTTGATKKQIAGVEKFITKTSLASGVVDDDLRPAFQRITQATKDTGKAQELLRLALDISAGSGKSLESVANSLGKAYGGNLSSLQRLGLGLDKATIKSGDFQKAQKALEDTFAGQSQVKANSFEGRIERFKVAMDEAKESIGYAILDAIQPMAEKWLPILSKAAQDAIDGFMGKKGKGGAHEIGVALHNMAKAIGDILGIIVGNNGTGEMKSFAETLQDVADSIQAITDAINFLKPAFKILLDINKHLPNLVTVVNAVKGLGDFGASFAEGLRSLGANIGGGISGIGSGLTGIGGVRAMGGVVRSNTPFLVGENGPELFVPSGSGNIVPTHALGSGTTIINLNGIVDAESARRAIERLLQRSSIRTGAINLQGSVI